jgi:hypothetical protein
LQNDVALPLIGGNIPSFNGTFKEFVFFGEGGGFKHEEREGHEEANDTDLNMRQLILLR